MCPFICRFKGSTSVGFPQNLFGSQEILEFLLPMLPFSIVPGLESSSSRTEKKKKKEDITVGREQISQDGVFRLSPHILQIMTMTEIIDSTVHAHHEVLARSRASLCGTPI